MKYFEVEFTISPYSADASDVLAAMAGEAGFETFEETETGLKGYVQQSLFDVSVLNAALEDFPLRTPPSVMIFRKQKIATGMSSGNKKALSRLLLVESGERRVEREMCIHWLLMTEGIYQMAHILMLTLHSSLLSRLMRS